MLRFIHITALLLFLAFASLTWAGAAESAAQPRDQELIDKSAQFEAFATNKVQQLNRNHVLSKKRMQVTRQSDGTYKGLYHQIDEQHMTVKVRRSSSKSIPYVGIISYQEQVFEAQAPSLAQLNNRDFDLVQIIPNKHLFSYKKGRWQ